MSRRNPLPEECLLLRVDDEEEQALDEAVHALFKKARIHPTGRVVTVVLCNEEVVGAAMVSSEYDDSLDDWLYSFDVAVDDKWRRKTIARTLVQDVLNKVNKGSASAAFRVEVVNPSMAKLLESFGFQAASEDGWSPHDPYMTLNC